MYKVKYLTEGQGQGKLTEEDQSNKSSKRFWEANLCTSSADSRDCLNITNGYLIRTEGKRKITKSSKLKASFTNIWLTIENENVTRTSPELC